MMGGVSDKTAQSILMLPESLSVVIHVLNNPWLDLVMARHAFTIVARMAVWKNSGVYFLFKLCYYDIFGKHSTTTKKSTEIESFFFFTSTKYESLIYFPLIFSQRLDQKANRDSY